jgi:hypothetical protein
MSSKAVDIRASSASALPKTGLIVIIPDQDRGFDAYQSRNRLPTETALTGTRLSSPIQGQSAWE